MEAVPLGFALFLLELTVGGILVTAALDWDGEVSAGFLFLNTAFLVLFGAGAVWLRVVLPVERLVPYPVDAARLHSEPLWWGGAVALAAVYAVLLRLDRRGLARLVGTLSAIAGAGALTLGAAVYVPPGVPFGLLLATLLTGALALGTVWSGMMLGHWYLVTPRLAPRPLLRLTGALALCLAVLGLLLASQTVGAPDGGPAGGAVAPLFWLRAGVGVLFPLVLCVLVWRTARVRSMMSATGLLYIALGTVLAGQIIASALFFLAGTPL